MSGTQRFVQSGPFEPSLPGEPVKWIKHKYLQLKPLSKGKTNPDGRKGIKRLRRPKTDREKALIAAQQAVKHVRHVLPNGKARMEHYGPE